MGFRVLGFRSRVQSFKFRIWVVMPRVSGVGFRVSVVRLRVAGRDRERKGDELAHRHASLLVWVFGVWCLEVWTTRWTTTLPSKVTLPHAIYFRPLCGANLVTRPFKFRRSETFVPHRVDSFVWKSVIRHFCGRRKVPRLGMSSAPNRVLRMLLLFAAVLDFSKPF